MFGLWIGPTPVIDRQLLCHNVCDRDRVTSAILRHSLPTVRLSQTAVSAHLRQDSLLNFPDSWQGPHSTPKVTRLVFSSQFKLLTTSTTTVFDRVSVTITTQTTRKSLGRRLLYVASIINNAPAAEIILEVHKQFTDLGYRATDRSPFAQGRASINPMDLRTIALLYRELRRMSRLHPLSLKTY